MCGVIMTSLHVVFGFMVAVTALAVLGLFLALPVQCPVVKRRLSILWWALANGLATLPVLGADVLFGKHIVPPWTVFYALAVAAAIITGGLALTKHTVLAADAMQANDKTGNALRWQTWLAAVAFLFLLTGLCWYEIDQRAIDRLRMEQRNAYTRLIRSMPLPDPQPDRNPWLLYDKVFAQFEFDGMWRPFRTRQFNNKIYLNAPGYDVTQKEPQEILAATQDILSLTRKTPDYPVTPFRPEMSKPLVCNLPDLYKLRAITELLGLDAIDNAERGHVKTALRNLAAGHRIAMNLAEHPTEINLLLAIGLDWNTVEQTEVVLYRARKHLQPGDISLPVAPDAIPITTLRASMLQEHDSAILFTTLMMIRDKTWTGNYYPWNWLEQHTIPIGYRLFLVPHDLTMAKRQRDKLESMRLSPCLSSRTGFPTPELVEGAYWPQFSNVDPQGMILGFADLQGARRLVTLAYAVEGYRVDNGNYPETLDVLTPNYIERIPIDPHDPDKEKLRMLPMQGGCILYSVGWDHTDNGATEPLTRMCTYEEPGTDITFCLGTAYARRRLMQTGKR